MKIIFDDSIKFFFNKNNISIIEDAISNKKFIYIYFYIPFETYCKDKKNIIINDNIKDIINIDLTNNIFIKNNNIQSKERLSINITEIFPLNTRYNKNKNIINVFQNYNINTPITIKYTGISNTGGSIPLNECSFQIMYNNKHLLNKKFKRDK